MFYMRDLNNNNNKFLSDYSTEKRSHYDELFLQSLGYIIAKEICFVLFFCCCFVFCFGGGGGVLLLLLALLITIRVSGSKLEHLLALFLLINTCISY